MPILLAWLGNTDLRASEGSTVDGPGPILSAAKAMSFAAVHLLSDHGPQKTKAYAQWLESQVDGSVFSHSTKLTSPTSFEEIYRAADRVIQEVKAAAASEPLTFHLSPGTPAMAAVWIVLSKTRHPAVLIESSKQHGVKEVRIPFEMSAEFDRPPSSGPDGMLVQSWPLR